MDPGWPDARQILGRFEPVWAELSPQEQQDLHRWRGGSAAFAFRADGIAALARVAGGRT